VFPAGLAEKFAFVKRREMNATEFEALLNAARWHFRGVLLNDVSASPADTVLIKRTARTLKTIESMSRQAVTGTINRKLALEVLLLEV
ncbi:MAG: hypothetical protein ACREHG_01415, partial [Candidatus Saccharimonadales bacterium]